MNWMTQSDFAGLLLGMIVLVPLMVTCGLAILGNGNTWLDRDDHEL